MSYSHPWSSEMGGGGSSYGNNPGGGNTHNNFDFHSISDAPYLPADIRRDPGELILPHEHQPYEYDFTGSTENLLINQYSTGPDYQHDWVNPAVNQPQQWLGEQVNSYPDYSQQQQSGYDISYDNVHPSQHDISSLTMPQRVSHYATASPASSHSSGYDSPHHSPGLHHLAIPQVLPQTQHTHLSHHPTASGSTSSRASPSDSDQQDAGDDIDPRIEPWLRQEANIPPNRPVGLTHIPGRWDNPNEKPPLAHRILMGLAIYESEEKQLTLSQIYDAIENRFSYYADTSNGKKWQRSMRHSLSLYSMFENKQRPLHGTGKGGYWRLVFPDPGRPYKRERKRKPAGTPDDDDGSSEEFEESDDSDGSQGIYRSSRPVFGHPSMPGPSGSSINSPGRSSSSPSIPTIGAGGYSVPPHVAPRPHHQVDMPERRSSRRGERPPSVGGVDPRGKSRASNV